MKIVALRATRVRLALAKPYKLSKVYGTKADADAIVLRLESDDGLVGYGEADPHTPFTADTPGGVMAAMTGVSRPVAQYCATRCRQVSRSP